MYKIGDIVMHGYSGICKITGKEKLRLGRENALKAYYVLVPLYETANTIYVPVTAEEQMRRPLSTSEVKELIKDIPEMENNWIDDMKKRKDTYASMIKSGKPADLLGLVHAIYSKDKERKAIGKRISEADEKQLMQAEKVLNGELAYGLGIKPEEVHGLISKTIEKPKLS